MARSPTQNLTIRLSILDRLLDDAPTATTERPLPPHQALELAVAGVRRDLEQLLNCRQTWIDERVLANELLAGTITGYGLPDFSGSALDERDSQKRVKRAIEYAIRQFEPRLQSVVVTPEQASPERRALRFRIDAVLCIDPVREPVTFDTVVLSTGVAEVREV